MPLIYHIDHRYTGHVINAIVGYLARKDKAALEKAWPFGADVMSECLASGCCKDFRILELDDDEIAAVLLRGAKDVD